MARHELLLEALGPVFPEEEHSYQLVSKLSWILPTIILCAGLVDLIFVIVYMKFAHPWKDIISKEKKPERSQFFVSLDSINTHESSLDCVAKIHKETQTEEASWVQLEKPKRSKRSTI